MARRLFLIVLDSLGIGALPDAAAYGDAGSDTLAAIAKSPEFRVPNLERLGLFNIDGIAYGNKTQKPLASFGRMAERSAGKDTIIGHWEIAGVVSERLMPTYPEGFPPGLMNALSQCFGRPVLCGKPYSGTEVLLDFGREHVETGALIVYTSADSVLQIAAHEDVVPVPALYDICEKARALMRDEHGVGRIIARPFLGDYPNYARTPNRHDYALPPPSPTMLDALKEAGLDVLSVGKINDIFAGRGVTSAVKTKSNMDGMDKTIAIAEQDFHGLCFVNLVDFDMVYGHRNDVHGYARALTEFDARLGELLPLLRQEDALILTADHGCDPATPSTDHSREYTPMLICGGQIRQGVNLGTRPSMADIAATVQEYFGVKIQTLGNSFLREIAL